TNGITSWRLQEGLKLFGFLLLTFVQGCSHVAHESSEGLTERILPPLGIHIDEEFSSPKKTVQEAADGRRAGPEPANSSNQLDPVAVKSLAPVHGSEVSSDPAQTLTL